MKRRGMTLVELLITMVLLGALTSSMFWLLTIAKAQWQRGASRSSVRQEVQTLFAWLDNDLADSEASLMTDNTTGTPVGFCFPSGVNAQGQFVTDTSGGIAWQKWIVVYIPSGTTRLLRRDVFVTFPDPAVALTTAELAGYCDGSGRVLSTKAQGLTLSIDPNTGVVSVGVTLQGSSDDGKIDRISSTMSILTRN